MESRTYYNRSSVCRLRRARFHVYIIGLFCSHYAAGKSKGCLGMEKVLKKTPGVYADCN